MPQLSKQKKKILQNKSKLLWYKLKHRIKIEDNLLRGSITHEVSVFTVMKGHVLLSGELESYIVESRAIFAKQD